MLKSMLVTVMLCACIDGCTSAPPVKTANSGVDVAELSSWEMHVCLPRAVVAMHLAELRDGGMSEGDAVSGTLEWVESLDNSDRDPREKATFPAFIKLAGGRLYDLRALNRIGSGTAMYGVCMLEGAKLPPADFLEFVPFAELQALDCQKQSNDVRMNEKCVAAGVAKVVACARQHCKMTTAQ